MMTIMTTTMMKTKIQPCPICGSDMEFLETQGTYSTKCSHCKYSYGGFRNKEYMIEAWNALATVFPMSVRVIVNSMPKGVSI